MGAVRLAEATYSLLPRDHAKRGACMRGQGDTMVGVGHRGQQRRTETGALQGGNCLQGWIEEDRLAPPSQSAKGAERKSSGLRGARVHYGDPVSSSSPQPDPYPSGKLETSGNQKRRVVGGQGGWTDRRTRGY